MIFKLSFIVFLLTTTLLSKVEVVPIVNKSISYKKKIYSQNVRLVQVSEKYKCKKYVNLIDLKKNKYFAKKHLNKNKIVCAKDVYIPKENKVKFRFGNLEIEKNAELIRETKSYIKIKNIDGTIEKIYTDGRNTK